MLKVIYDPMALSADPARVGQSLRTAFPGNRIPAARMDRVGKALMDAMVPLSNRPGNGTAHTGNYYDSTNGRTVNNKYDTRVDWARNERHTLYGQVTMSWQTQQPAEFWGKYAESNRDAANPRFTAKIGNNFILSPTFIANVMVGSSRWSEQQHSKGYGFDYTAIGFTPSLAAQFDVATPPELRLNGLNGAVFGNNRYLTSARMVHNAQANFTKELNAHSVKFGWSLEKSIQNASDSNSSAFRFDNLFTSGPGWDNRATASGYAPASLLLGTGLGGNAPIAAHMATTDNFWGWYVQDAWKVTRRLTVNIGIRHEIQQARTERFDRMNYFDPQAVNPIGANAGMPGLKGALQFVGPGHRSPWDTSYHDFAPRIGIGFQLSRRVAIRTGYGIFYSRSVSAAAKTSTLGFSNDTTWIATNDSGRTPFNLLMNFDAPDFTYSLGGSQYPNISDRKLLKLENQDRLHWFNTAVFSQAAPYTFGNAPRWTGEVRTARNNNWAVGVMKYFKVGEAVRLQLRADLFNALNHARFGTPITDVTAANFGQVNSTRGTPRLIQLGLRASF